MEAKRLNSKTPLVSLGIPSYKKPEMLRRCLESVFSQTWLDKEVIVTDDSPDAAVEAVVRDFQTSGNSVAFQRNQPALGSPGNWNRAMSLARGKYVQILHHDDWYGHGRSLEALVLALESHPEASMAFGSSTEIDQHGRPRSTNRPSGEQVAKLNSDPSVIVWGNCIGAPSVVLFRRVPELQFDETLIWQVDVEYYLRYLRYTRGNALYVPAAEINISVAPGRVTDLCTQDQDLILAETVHLFELAGVSTHSSRLRGYFREFPFAGVSSLRIPFRHSRYGWAALVGYSGGILGRSWKNLKSQVKKLLRRGQR